VVAGSSGPFENGHAVVWLPNTAGSYSITDLGALPGDRISTATGISTNGHVAGNSAAVPAERHAVL